MNFIFPGDVEHIEFARRRGSKDKRKRKTSGKLKKFGIGALKGAGLSTAVVLGSTALRADGRAEEIERGSRRDKGYSLMDRARGVKGIAEVYLNENKKRNAAIIGSSALAGGLLGLRKK